MLALYIIFVVYLVLPALAAAADNAAVKHGLMTTSPRRMLTSRIKSLGVQVYFAAAVLSALAVLALLMGYKFARGAVQP